jgi:uncharacterized protein YcbX
MLGTVSVLRRYPVKSMLGEEVQASYVSRSGLDRDRRLAVVSRRTGKVASAKYPRLWRGLLTMSAAAVEDAAADDAAGNATASNAAARITLPGGTTVCSTDPDVDEVLSALLDEPVTLTATPPPGATLDRAIPEAVLRDGVEAQVPAELIEIGAGAPPGTFVDFAPLHLLTTATLDQIAELSPHRRARLERYRPNIVIRTEDGRTGFAENDWLGRFLSVGSELVLRVIARTPRCAVPTLAHGDLPRDAEALRVLARHNRVRALPQADPEPCAGVYAEVLRPGRIRAGDPVRLLAVQFGPDDLAGPAGDGLPAPVIALCRDEQQAAPALVVGPRVPGGRRAGDDVPDLDQQPDTVAGHPQHHDRHPGAVVPGTAVRPGGGPDGVGDQLADDELGRLGQVLQAPFAQHGAGVQAGARGGAGQRAQRQGGRQRP